MLWLNLLPRFSSNLNETCFTWSLWSVDVHGINDVRPQGISVFLFLQILIINTEKIVMFFLWKSFAIRLCKWIVYGFPFSLWQIRDQRYWPHSVKTLVLHCFCYNLWFEQTACLAEFSTCFSLVIHSQCFFCLLFRRILELTIPHHKSRTKNPQKNMER